MKIKVGLPWDNVQFQKILISIPLPQRVNGNSKAGEGGGGKRKVNVLKEKYGLNWNFWRGGWGTKRGRGG